MGPIEVVVAQKAERTLTVATPGNPATQLVPGRGLRFALKDQPTVTAEFVLAPNGSVEKVVVQPIGIFEPKR